MAKSYKTMAANQDWMDNQRINFANRSAKSDRAVTQTTPRCKKCGGETLLARVTPVPNADHDSRTYECLSCGNVQTALVQLAMPRLDHDR